MSRKRDVERMSREPLISWVVAEHRWWLTRQFLEEPRPLSSLSSGLGSKEKQGRVQEQGLAHLWAPHCFPPDLCLMITSRGSLGWGLQAWAAIQESQDGSSLVPPAAAVCPLY